MIEVHSGLLFTSIVLLVFAVLVSRLMVISGGLSIIRARC